MILHRVKHQRNVKSQGFGVCFCYKRLNLVINDLDFVILGLDLLIYGFSYNNLPLGRG